MLRIGIDVGGTFTDLAAIDSERGDFITLKISSTPQQPERAVLDALDALLARYETAPQISFLGHSTTVATNALLGQVGLELPRVGMVTTYGFRDVLEIGRQNRSEVYNLFVDRPPPLVAREDRLTVRERIDHRGQVLVPLDEADVARACAALRERGVGAVAVCLLNSYANDDHERRVADAIAHALPDVRIARSSDIDPEYRECERFSTAVVDAALTPIVQGYLQRLQERLRAKGFDTPLYVMRSDGGMATSQYAAQRPAAIIESGPASGAIAAAALGARVGCAKLLSFDMGGTTAKAGAIVDGIAQVAGEFEAAGKTHSGRSIKGSGYPVRFPFVDLAEISAGGGTIAWIDDAGSLRVGPLSAGADPGPACYGTSERATVTDANVVLGRLHQTHLLGGAFPIDASRSRAAIAALADRLHLGIEQTAAGIVTLIDAEMSKVLRIVTIERGLDPRDFTLAAFGGGGPLHACALAEELGITRVLIPARPGIFSAYGLLVAELRERFVHPTMSPLEAIDPAQIERVFSGFEERARGLLLEQGARPDRMAFRREHDARYAGQGFELRIDHASTVEEIARNFHAAHRARYGYDAPHEPVEIVNSRLSASGALPEARALSASAASAGSNSAAGEPIPSRGVWLEGRRCDVPLYHRDALTAQSQIAGPAIVEQYDTTTFLAPGWTLTVADEVLELRYQAVESR